MNDIVVIGGGMAGMVAAARAAELGLSVTLLESGTEAHYPCNARISGGVLHVGYSDITRSPAALRKVIDTSTGGETDAAQADAMSANGTRLVEWLREFAGVTYSANKVDWQTYILSPPRRLIAGHDWEGKGPDILLTTLRRKLEELGGRVVLGARALELRMQSGRCTGVVAAVGGQSRTFEAKAVLIADGGFQADLELLGKHITKHPESLRQRGSATGRGDGLRMAKAVGAALAGLDRFYGHLLCRDAMTNDGVWPYPELDAIACAGIVVGPDGRRLADEGVGGVALSNAIARLDDPLGATIVFDAAIWDGPGRSARIPANPTLPAAGGTVHAAETLVALAAKAGLDPAHLQSTVAAYNAAISQGRLDSLDPPRSTTKHPPMPIATAPFHAIPICAGITYTMGGILVDGQCRVIHADGHAIAGLFAAGSTTGGLEGGSRTTYLGGLAKAGIQGLIAADTAAAQRQTSR